MNNIESLTDCPLLENVKFFDVDDEIMTDDVHVTEYKGDYRKKSPNELGLTFVASRKEEDFTRLYNVIKHTLYKNIVKIVGCNRDDIECVADSTMLCVYLNIDKFDVNKSSFCTWVHTIAKNIAINYIARSGHKNNNVYSTDFSDLYDSSVVVDDQDSYTEEYCSPSYIDDEDGFIDIVYDKGVYKVYTIEDVIDTFFSVIYSCIEDLPSVKKDTFVERFINNRTIKETAQRLGVSATSIKRYYQDGIHKVVGCIKQEHPELYEMMKDLY